MTTASTQRRQWETRVQEERDWAFAKDASAAATIPPMLFELLAEEHLTLATPSIWPVRWVQEDGELVPEMEIVLETDAGWCIGSDGQHALTIECMADLECAMNEMVDECVCSDCQDYYRHADDDARYEDWRDECEP